MGGNRQSMLTIDQYIYWGLILPFCRSTTVHNIQPTHYPEYELIACKRRCSRPYPDWGIYRRPRSLYDSVASRPGVLAFDFHSAQSFPRRGYEHHTSHWSQPLHPTSTTEPMTALDTRRCLWLSIATYHLRVTSSWSLAT